MVGSKLMAEHKNSDVKALKTTAPPSMTGRGLFIAAGTALGPLVQSKNQQKKRARKAAPGSSEGGVLTITYELITREIVSVQRPEHPHAAIVVPDKEPAGEPVVWGTCVSPS